MEQDCAWILQMQSIYTLNIQYMYTVSHIVVMHICKISLQKYWVSHCVIKSQIFLLIKITEGIV